MTRSPSSVIVILLGFLGSIALAAQDKYTLQVPNGLAFSDFREYENWEDIAVSQTENGIKVIVANPTMPYDGGGSRLHLHGIPQAVNARA